MKKTVSTQERRKLHNRKRVTGTSDKPRLSVHRTSQHIYAQLIDDAQGITLLGVSEKAVETKGTKTEKAKALGALLAKKAVAAKVTTVVFDRGAYRYHGRVKAVAEGAREGGLAF